MGRINLSSKRYGRPSSASFFLIFFHVKQNIILTIASKKDFGKILRRARVIYKNVFSN